MSQRTEVNLHVRGDIAAYARSAPSCAGVTLRIPCVVHTDVSDGDLHVSTSVAGVATLHLDAVDARQLYDALGAALVPVPVEAPLWTIESVVAVPGNHSNGTAHHAR